MSYVTHIKVSCHKYKCIMSHTWMRHVTRMNASCHTYERIMSHIYMHRVTYMHGSCHVCKHVISHKKMSHVTQMHASRHTHEWIMAHIRCVTSHVYMSHGTHNSRHACRIGARFLYRVCEVCEVSFSLSLSSYGGQDRQNALSLQVFFHKRAL